MTDRRTLDLGRAIINVVALLLVLSYALPDVYLLMTSVKPAADVQQIPPSFFPNRLSLENFWTVLTTQSVPSAFANSVITASAYSSPVADLGGTRRLRLHALSPADHGAVYSSRSSPAWYQRYRLACRCFS